MKIGRILEVAFGVVIGQILAAAIAFYMQKIMSKRARERNGDALAILKHIAEAQEEMRKKVEEEKKPDAGQYL